MKTNWIYIIFLIFNLSCFSCRSDSNNQLSKVCIIQQDLIYFENFNPDSVTILFPTLACSECLITSKNIMNKFHVKKNIDFVIIPNYQLKNSKIIYSNQINQITNLKIDSLGMYSSFVEDDPKSIWLLIYKDRCIYKLKFEGGIEDQIIKFLDDI